MFDPSNVPISHPKALLIIAMTNVNQKLLQEYLIDNLKLKMLFLRASDPHS